MTTRFATPHPVTTDVDISSIAFWRKPFDERETTFATLRREAPVSWQPPFEVAGYPPEAHQQQGLWAVTRAADITRVSLDNETFISGNGISAAPIPLEIEALSTFFLGMDPPQHTMYRRLVSSAFTPKAITRITDLIHQRAAEIVDGILELGEFDLVDDFASLLPMMTVCDLIGVPESERIAVRTAADLFVADFGPDDVPEGMDPLTFRISQAQYLHALGASLAAHRREHPADDLMTNLVQTEVDGHRLTDEEIGAFMVNMSVAGNDTTRQTTTRTVLTLAEHPDQRAWLEEDFDGRIAGAIEEFVRYASPVMTFARTAVRDTEVAGVEIAAGDKVGLFYCSGNRDESVFDEPGRFDLARPRTPHVGFGGGGVHYCLGNGVAKTQLRALFGEYLRRVPAIELGEPEYLPSNFINGVLHVPAKIVAGR